MATKSEIAAYFQELNIVTSDLVLDKCLELCLKYNIEAEDFCDQWYAYTASHLNGAIPTVEHLEKLERKEFQKNKDQIYYKRNVSSPKTTPYKNEENTEARSIASSSSYTATTPKSSRKERQRTLQPIHSKADISTEISSTETYLSSPLGTQSKKFSERSDSRSVQYSYGTPAKYKREKDFNIEIRHVNEENVLDTKFKYMYEIMGKKAKCLNNMTQWLGHNILKKHGLVLTEGTLKTYLGDMVTYGRIVSDSDGKINTQSTLLEGTLESNMGNTISLNLNKVPKYSLFPGQVVVVQGNNANSNTFITEKVFTDSLPQLPLEPPVVNEQMQIVVASGPYTLQGSLLFEPLKDLLKYVSDYKPHVLILIGPFLERNHESIHSGELLQTFDSFFETLIENIMNSLKDMDIQVIVVSSQNEAHHHPVYPTPSYNISEKYDNLKFFPDPCMININGLLIGVTSADILFHISNFEIYQDKHPVGPTDRMGRLVSHLLNQCSFYPLYPPYKGINMDHELFEQCGVMDYKPHILIVPSNLRYFAKNVQDCLVINPERLTKRFVAGTFARIEVNPGRSQSICNRTSCEILRV